MTDYDQIKPLLREAAKDNFWAFCCYYDWDFFRVKRRFLKEVALLFQLIVDEYKKGNAINVSVSMPPRSGKSYITSLFAAYWLGQFPELSVMRNCCTSPLYQKFSYDTRNIIKSEKYRQVFQTVELQPDKQNLDGWNLTTSKQVGYFGAGVGGTIIGFGANLAITDDLYKGMYDALSDSTDANVKLWKESAHDSRKEKNCPEIFVGTRWKVDDIIGNEIDSGKLYKSIAIPALINEQSFCEDVKSTDEYIEIRNKITDSVWGAEYMQDPITISGILIPKSKLRFIEPSTIDKSKVVYRFAIIDPANTGGDKFSQPFISVFQSGNDLGFFVDFVLHNTFGVEANAERNPEKLKQHKTDQLLIEQNGLGLAAVLLLNKSVKQICELSPFTSSVNKDARILSNFEFIPKYFYFSKTEYEQNNEYKLFIDDLTSYNKNSDNKHKKDAIDVMSSAAHFMKLKYASILY